jgi:hypothetical protein
MPGSILPTTGPGVLGAAVLVITAIFAVLAIGNLLPRPRRMRGRQR